MTHVHIADDHHHALVYVGADGHAHSDGSDLGEFAIHQLNHRGLGTQHGQRLLHSIVERLDSATMMSARRCHKPECLAHLSQ